MAPWAQAAQLGGTLNHTLVPEARLIIVFRKCRGKFNQVRRRVQQLLSEAVVDDHEYTGVISLIERGHRHFLEIVKLELDALGIHDINNVQALILFNIGEAEMTVGELGLRGCYLGSNVSYNVKKLAESGYLAQERSMHDRRSIHVRLTEKGLKLRGQLILMHQRHIEMLNQTVISEQDLQATTETLRRLERFWVRALDPSFFGASQATRWA
jgi:DNA-binding MarR family transcriptional regulator